MGGYRSPAAAVRPLGNGSEITPSLLENIFLEELYLAVPFWLH